MSTGAEANFERSTFINVERGRLWASYIECLAYCSVPVYTQTRCYVVAALAAIFVHIPQNHLDRLLPSLQMVLIAVRPMHQHQWLCHQAPPIKTFSHTPLLALHFHLPHRRQLLHVQIPAQVLRLARVLLPPSLLLHWIPSTPVIYNSSSGKTDRGKPSDFISWMWLGTSGVQLGISSASCLHSWRELHHSLVTMPRNVVELCWGSGWKIHHPTIRWHGTDWWNC